MYEFVFQLLISIFFPNNPLHDGGVIIQGDKITSAGAVFPTSENLKISKRLGTRHRAALGISEENDSIAIIVSEETGRVSLAIEGELLYNMTIDEVKLYSDTVVCSNDNGAVAGLIEYIDSTI